jgi:predicted nucleic acid-binding protein
MALICDTGILYGALDAADDDHTACSSVLKEASEPIVIPSPVLVEVDWLSSSRLQPEAFDLLLSDIDDGTLGVIDLLPAEYKRVQQLCHQYRDLPLGFVDAAVVAVTERLGEPKLATLDCLHFTIVRPRHVRSLELLPDLT